VAGTFSYNEGLIGSTDPAGSDSYNKGKIGKSGPIGSSSYNRGVSVTSGGFGAGSKPLALHTEFAEGDSASDRAYGTQDVVFYLQRAGGDGGDGGDDSFEGVYGSFGKETSGSDFGDVTSEFGGEGSYSDQSYWNQVPTGDSDTISGGQTAPGQIGAAFAAPSLFPRRGALLGTLTGHFETKDLEIGLGETTQNGGFQDNRDRLIGNAIGSVPNLERDLVLAGTAASEKMFAGMLNKAFSPDEQLDGNRTPEQIRKSLSRASSAELSVQLAKATGGVRRVRDLTALINDGAIGLTSQKTRAIQDRLSRHGKVRRRK
jgi:hypothetical protein